MCLRYIEMKNFTEHHKDCRTNDNEKGSAIDVLEVMSDDSIVP